MKVRFYLRLNKVKKNGEVPIYVDVSVPAGRLQKYTGECCLEKDFLDKEKHTVGKFVKGKPELNDYLARLKNDIEERNREMRKEGLLFMESDLELILRPPLKYSLEPVNTLKSLLLSWQTKRKNISSSQGLRKWKQVIGHLENYAPNAKIESINQKFIDNYVEYLIENVPTIQSNNTISRHIKFFKMVLQEAGRDAMWIKDNFAYDADKPFLYQEELMKFYTFNYSRDVLRERADAASFMGFTGLRYSDAVSVGRSDLFEDEEGLYLQLRQVKTKKPVQIYLNKYAIEIIKKYDGKDKLRLVPVTTNQDMNVEIKICAKSCGLDREINTVVYHGNKRQNIIEPLHNIITCHTFRHTFATISLNNGMPSEVLAELMGITLNTVSVYAKLLNKTKADFVNKVWG